jgi:hypothetical protein
MGRSRLINGVTRRSFLRRLHLSALQVGIGAAQIALGVTVLSCLTAIVQVTRRSLVPHSLAVGGWCAATQLTVIDDLQIGGTNFGNVVRVAEPTGRQR